MLSKLTQPGSRPTLVPGWLPISWADEPFSQWDTGEESCSEACDISHLGFVLSRFVPVSQPFNSLSNLFCQFVVLSHRNLEAYPNALRSWLYRKACVGNIGPAMAIPCPSPSRSPSQCELQGEVCRQVACPDQTATLMRNCTRTHLGTPHSSDKIVSLVNPGLWLYKIQHEVRV